MKNYVDPEYEYITITNWYDGPVSGILCVDNSYYFFFDVGSEDSRYHSKYELKTLPHEILIKVLMESYATYVRGEVNHFETKVEKSLKEDIKDRLPGFMSDFNVDEDAYWELDTVATILLPYGETP